MRMRGVEPPRANAHKLLRLARLPIPPHPQNAVSGGFLLFLPNPASTDSNINAFFPFIVKDFTINLQSATRKADKSASPTGGMAD